MIDINFYRKFNQIKESLEKGQELNKEKLFNKLEDLRDKNPVIYNIETTNVCNMKCQMCPRTTKMTRSIETMTKETFSKIVEQIRPHTDDDWQKWESFVQEHYGIFPNDMSENHFFLYIIPRVIQLHGYGDPLIDRNIADEVKLLKEKGFQSYFSCNPANIDIDRTIEIFESGLDYIKYSIESVDDEEHKQIRGQLSNFTESYNKILKLLEIKKEKNYKTTIIITMLNLDRRNQSEEWEKLKEKFKDLDVYIYLKSEDQQWYRKNYHGTKSVHWSEPCKHPWMTMTIKSNGEVAMCMEDYNNEIILGDAKKESLYDIWNGEKYNKFRKDHFDLTRGIKCMGECDMKLVGEFFKKTKIIITGSRGLIGSEVTRYFKENDKYEVLELDLSSGHDLTNEEFVRNWFEKNKADYLINLFALNHHIDSDLEKPTLFNIDLNTFRKFMEVNVTALFSVCREFAKNGKAKGIVNFSSIYGIVSPNPQLYENGEKHIGYSVSKGAVVQLSRHLAIHLAPKIRVNCLVPGGVKYQQSEDFIKKYSQHAPMKRMMNKNELNKILEHLCSEDSSYMTGSVINIDGGWTAQ